MVIYCIIVCYHPDVLQLFSLCNHLLGDRAKVIVVDNTEVPSLGELPGGCTLISLGYNSGIAHAQNAGVAAALSAGATVLVFFDQDSRIDSGFLNRLVSAIQAGTPEIVSPLCVDDATGNALPSIRIDRYGLSRPVYPSDASSRYPVDIVISSGTAATREVFELAGTLDDGLFIDFVDDEWCLRCRSQANSDIYRSDGGHAPHYRHPAFQAWPSDHPCSQFHQMLLPDPEQLSAAAEAPRSLPFFPSTDCVRRIK